MTGSEMEEIEPFSAFYYRRFAMERRLANQPREEFSHPQGGEFL